MVLGSVRSRSIKYLTYFQRSNGNTIDEAFTVMYLLICKMFENEDVEIDTREIEHSYCPGKFDLSIDGKSLPAFHNVVRGGIAVQIYLCVEGSGSERAEMMRVFYEHALKGEVTKFKYPDIHPECMASLETLFEREIKVQDVMFQLLHAIKDLGGNLNMDPITEDEWTRYEGYFDKMIDRNEKMNRSIEAIKRETTFKIENLIQLKRDKIKCLTYFIMLSDDWFENALESSVFQT